MAYLKSPQDEDQQGGPIQQSGDAPTDSSFSKIGQAIGSGGAAPNTSFTQTNTATGKKILDKNANEQGNQYDVTKPYQEAATKGFSDLASAQQAHQANVESVKNSRQASNEQVNKAIGGDEGEFNNIKGILQNPVQYDQYKGISAPNLNDVNALNTSVGLQGELQKQAANAGNYNYNRGQAALDSTLLGRNQQAQQNITDVQKKYGDLYQQQAKTAQEESDREAQANAAIAQQQQAIKDRVSGYGNDLADQANSRADQSRKQAESGLNQKYQDYINKYIGGLNNSNTRISDAQKQAIRDATGNSSYVPGSVQAFLANSGPKINMNDYLNGTQDVGDLYGQNDLDQFNRIAQLGGKAPPGGAGKVSAKNIDYTALQKKLDEISGNSSSGTQANMDAESRVANQKAEAQRAADEAAAREEERKQNRPGGIKSKADQVEPGNIAPKVVQNWMGQGNNTNLPDLGTQNITNGTINYGNNAISGQPQSDYQKIVNVINGGSPGDSGIIPNVKKSAGNMNPVKYL